MKKYLLSLLIFLCYGLLKGQTIPTPNASAFGIFGVYPASSSSGIPVINIPVYDFNYGGLSLPIELSYNPNMVKPKLCGSWVGLGWNLSAGGVITRTVLGGYDERTYRYDFEYPKNYDMQAGYWHHHSLGGNDWFGRTRVEAAAKSGRDFAPDEFSFSAGGLSGQFYLDHNKEWKVRCKEKIRVEINSSDFIETPPYRATYDGVTIPNIKRLFRVTLIDTKGIRYVFGGSNQSVEKVAGDFKSFYLTEIKFPGGKKILYEYENGQEVTEVFPKGGSFSGSNVQVSNPVYLKKILTDISEITFYRSEKQKEFAKLDYISVKQKGGNELIRKFFDYENTPMDRLTLISLSEKDKNNVVGNRYDFNYNGSFVNVPDFYHFINTDHWGFYNTKPLATNPYTALLASREPDVANSAVGMLQKITYPTGGYSSYVWESHTFAKEVKIQRSEPLLLHLNDKYAGGVRIKEISNHDASDILLGRKKYNYNINYSLQNTQGRSSGILGWQPLFISGATNSFTQYYPQIPFRHSPLASNNIGPHVSYSEVTEIEENNGYVKTTFSNFDNGTNGEYMDEPEVSVHYSEDGYAVHNYISNAHERGMPLSIRSYNNQGALVKERTVEYQRINKNEDYARSLLIDYWSLSSWSGSAVKMYTNSYLPKKEIDILYNVSGQNPSLVENEYEYDLNSLLTKNTTKNSNGTSKFTTYAYPMQFIFTSNLYKRMSDANMMVPLETKKYMQTIGQAPQLLGSILTPYRLSPTETIVADKELVYEADPQNISSSSLMPTSLDPAVYDAKYEERIKYDNYTEDASLLQQTTLQGQIKSFQWDVTNTYMTAEVANVSNNYKVEYEPQVVTGTLEGAYGVATTRTVTFNHAYAGDINLSIAFFGAPTTNFQILTSLSSGGQYYHKTLCFSFGNPSACTSGNTSTFTYTNMPAGTYTLVITLDKPVTTGVNYSYLVKKAVPSGNKEFYFQDFEAPGVGTSGASTPHTGKGCLNSSYHTVNWVVPNQRSYVISYFYVQNGVWKYSGEIPYLNNTHTLMGSAVDDIRIYPKDAEMITYTYEPLVGMTSMIDAKGLTTYYEYDSFQRLLNVKDHQGNIIKNYNYYLRPKTYYNKQISKKVYKNDCSIGYYGLGENYIVPSAKYASIVSQADADAQASIEIANNGQIYANSNGECLEEGTYVTVCATSPREEIVGNYRDTYVTYSIKAFKDPEGVFPKQTSVPITYTYNGQQTVISVIGVINLGEKLQTREYIGPMGEDQEGEYHDYILEIIPGQSFQIANFTSCTAHQIDVLNSGSNTLLQNGQVNEMVFFDDLSSLCAYTSDMDKNVTSLYYHNAPQVLMNCFTDSTMQMAIPNGYYTFFKITDQGPNKWYKIQQGVIVEEGVCQ
ncbi:DUF5977 domain-containing protein [Pedobacter chitinilyticus]|uniref:DUF5977 domain-containing protein n=1 Tax=Pedobacter chitinilyticus TaxID=2233776 RepID=A0A3S3SUT1_9SPHI|nr:DUF5977 domain-containing protein [Pedobacter chitinilyticus]RWU08110.1 hypothetical protein DPV69_06930 [Pedobacter chitinilyticus]